MENYHQKYFNLNPPTFGLNFLENTNVKNQNFMLLCGFEKFENCYVRIDILERLFMQIINSVSENQKEIKMIPEMLNLLGCSKENFKKILRNMNYKIIEKNDEFFFKKIPKKIIKKNSDKKIKKQSPFEILKNLSFNQ